MPDWVMNHDIWKKAKAQAQKQGYTGESLYKVTTEIYKNMGGKIAKAKK